MITNSYLLIFAVAFMGCVLSTPLVTRIAGWAGAIDRPDQFRRVHKSATPRMGGLALAFGILISLGLVSAGGYLEGWPGHADWRSTQWAVLAAGLIVLVVGTVDDTRGMQPGLKLLGQAAAVLVLYAGGIRIDRVSMLGLSVELGEPSLVLGLLGRSMEIGLPGLLVTLLWFLGCMNIWNLIDGMDGLASGVGLLVSGTLMLIAIHQENWGAAILAAALAGGLAGFLLYNWHPACIFLGDSGSLLIGLLIGLIGVQYSLKKTSTVSLLFPLLAMGLPIADTAMAIFRRWLRNLPLSAADRRHVHHLLISAGLGPRHAAVLLYCFTAGLCGVVLLGVVYEQEALALLVGLSGCVAFLLILTSRRDELATLRADFEGRIVRRRQERRAARLTWEAIQRIELCESTGRIWEILLETTRALGCDSLRISCERAGRVVLEGDDEPAGPGQSRGPLSGPSATFRLSSGRDLSLTVELRQAADSAPLADIAFRYLQRLSLATAERLERLFSAGPPDEEPPARPTSTAPTYEPGTGRDLSAPGRGTWQAPGWLRLALGWRAAPAAAPSLGDD
jgi:UDP-GlcNAc:undecaprenyl-phosphate GlcNAc-1-phosphate transferase